MATDVRILVLEDDPNMLHVLQQVLQEEGYQVDACSAGDQAVELAREHSYDLVVADIKMDGLDGLGALSEVQAYQPDVGSLVVTGYANEAETERAARLGLNGLLKKPFELDRFLDTVAQILATRRRQVEARRKEDESLEQARWATEWTAQLLQARTEYPFHSLSRLTRQLSKKMGLEGRRTEQVCLAALWQAGGNNSCPIPSDAPSMMSEYLAAIEERWDGTGPNGLAGRSIPLESRILSLALVAAPGAVPESEWVKRFDPVALQALDQVSRSEQLEDSDEESAKDKGLLNLARTLLEVGDYPNAQKALQEMVNQEAASPQGVEATLELSRLKGFLGQKSEAVQLAGRAPETASHFGPLLAADTGYRSAVILKQHGADAQASGLLKESAGIYADLGLDTQSILCGLAQHWVSGSALTDEDCSKIELLLAPQNRTLLLDCLEWLVPCLLRSQLTRAEQSLAKIVIQFPQAVATALAQASPEERQFALKILKSLESPVAAGVIASLSSDAEPEIREQASSLESSDGGQSQAELTLRTLGRFELIHGNSVLPESAWRTSKVKYLFARLAASEGTVSEDSLIEDFWPGDVRRAKKNLQATTSYLRQTLRKAGVTGDPVQKVQGGLSLNPALSFWHDLKEVREASSQAKECLPDEVDKALSHFRRLFQTYDGPFLEECYMEWAIQVRREIEDIVIEASLKLAEKALERSRYDEALECARTALKLDPCLAEAIGFVMNAYLGLQRPSAAVRQFENYKSALALEFDAMPSIELERLHQMARLSL